MSKETLWHNFWKPGELLLKLNKIREKKTQIPTSFILFIVPSFVSVSLFSLKTILLFPPALFTSLTLALFVWLCRVPEGQQRVAACYLNLMCQIKALYLAYCSSHPSAVCILTDHRSAPLHTKHQSQPCRHMPERSLAFSFQSEKKPVVQICNQSSPLIEFWLF